MDYIFLIISPLFQSQSMSARLSILASSVLVHQNKWQEAPGTSEYEIK
jgi:hypothetical protein